MSFRYILRPNPSKPNNTSTRADLGVAVEDEEFFAKVAELSTKPVADCEVVFDAILSAFVGFARDTRSTLHLRDRLRMQPSSGGSFPIGTEPHTAEDIGARMNFTAGPIIVNAFETNLSIERVGEEGVRTPLIDRVVDNRTGTADHYTAADVLDIEGDQFAIDPADTNQGVFFAPTTGAPVRATRYVQVTKTHIAVIVPAGLTGSVNLSVACKYDTTSVRTGHFPTALTP